MEGWTQPTAQTLSMPSATTNLPPQVHLVICSSFLSLASKAEFLDLGYVSVSNPCRGPSPLSSRRVCPTKRPHV